MAIDFKSMRSSSRDSLQHLQREMEKTARGGGYQQDERYWRPTTDKAGNGFAIIRFLPAPPNEDIPYVQLWSHFFKGPTGQVYAENSLTTLGKEDPVSKMNSELWATGIEANKKLASSRKRKLNYIANIYVVKDPGNPSNEGKVFLYKFGKKIFEKLNVKMNPPEEEGIQGVNPFDFWEGCNMRLRVRQVDGFPNYEMSDFTEVGPLLDDDAELERIWRSEYSLQAEVAPDKFKTYEELEKTLERVLYGGSRAAPAQGNGAGRNSAADRFARDDDAPPQEHRRVDPPKQGSVSSPEDDDDGLNFFQRLADED